MLRALTVLTTIGFAANGARLRSRAGGLRRLDPRPDVAPVPSRSEGWHAVRADGVTLHPDTLETAAAWAEQEGLDAVDLVPGDLPVALRGNPAGLAPRDRTVGRAVRLRQESRRVVDLVRGHAPAPRSTRLADELRPLYTKELELGTDQHKPGTFRLDECADCGHVFQTRA